MRKGIIIFLAVLILGFGVSSASATTFEAFEAKVNIDDVFTNLIGDPFNFTGLGTITVTVSDPGDHYVALYVDDGIDESENTWLNEFGFAIGLPSAGQTWEIDEPGFGGIMGDIYANFTNSPLALDGMVFGGLFAGPEDVAMAIGWSFNVPSGETRVITFNLSTNNPGSGFYLRQYDPDSDADIYFTSSLGTQGVPEPSTMLLLGAGLAGLGYYGRRRRIR